MTVQVPVVLQVGGADCGAACLASVIAAYSGSPRGDDIRSSIEQSSRGTSFAHLATQARQYGMLAKGLRCPIESLGKVRLPAIAHWGSDHFVVVQSICSDGVECMDPRSGRDRVEHDVFKENYSGVILELAPSPSFVPVPRQPRASLSSVLKSLPSIRQRLAAIMVVGLALELCAMTYPIVLQTTIDRVVPTGDWGLLGVISAVLLSVAILQAGLTYGRGILTARLAASASFHLSAGAFWSLIQAPPAYVSRRSTGELLAKFSSLDALRSVIASTAVMVALDAIFVLIVMSILFSYAPWVACALLCVIGVFCVVRMLQQKAMNRENDQLISASSRQNSHLLESVQSIPTIRLLGLEDRRQETHQANVERVLHHEISIGHRLALSGTAQVLLFSVENIIFLGICSYLLMVGGITLGVMLAAMALKAMLSARVVAAFERVMQLNGLQVHLRRLEDLPQVRVESCRNTVSPGEALHIEFENVSFRYSADEPWVVKNFSLSVSPEEHVCLIGPSGQGKSTLLNIAAGLLEPVEGCIRVNGVRLNDLAIKDYWSRIAVVRQDDVLLEGTVAQNISGFDPEADEQEIFAVLELASFGNDLHTLPLGIHTKIGPGGEGLSGGQRQRVMIARALFRQPQLLILDEATSHLDAANEAAVARSIRQLGCSVLMAAHRHETVRGADRQVVVGLEQMGETAAV